MADLTLRVLTNPGDVTKNAPLTNAELDQNFINLDNGKAEASALAAYAPLASPAFTGVPTAPNPIPANNDNTTIATTNFVQTAVAAKVTGPASATDSAVALFDSTTGKLIKDSATTLPGSPLVGTTTTQTLINKIIDLANNTLTGTIAQFNTALVGADFATIAETETLSNKTLDAATNILTGLQTGLSIGGNAATANSAATCTGNSATATMAKQVPVSTNVTGTLVAGDTGTAVSAAGGTTAPSAVFAAGDVVSLVNDSGSDVTITQGSGLVMYNTANGSVGDRTLASRGLATIWFKSPTEAYISGSGLT